MEGYDVTAVELVKSNLEILRRNVAGLENITSYQGDAEDLSLFADNSFDAVLVLGPMYHLFENNLTEIDYSTSVAANQLFLYGVVVVASNAPGAAPPRVPFPASIYQQTPTAACASDAATSITGGLGGFRHHSLRPQKRFPV